MKLSREVKTGLLAVFSIATFVLGYNYLKGTNLLSKDRVFYALYDNVEGLDLSSVVTINGLKVGKVQSITIDQKTGNLIVKFNVENNFKFSKTSKAKIYSAGFISGKSIAIVPDYSSTVFAVQGDTLTSEKDLGILDLMSEKLAPLQENLQNSLVKADSLLYAVNDVLNTDTRENLRNAIANFNQTSLSFKKTSQSLQELLVDNQTHLNQSFKNLDKTLENVSVLSDSLAQIQIGKLISELENTISNFNQLSEKLNNGEGSMGKLLSDNSLYENLDGASRQLEQLIQDMKLNPKRYVHFSLFGKRPGTFELPENREQ